MLNRVNGIAYSDKNIGGSYQIVIHNWQVDASISFQLNRTEFNSIEIFVQAVLHTVMGNDNKVKAFRLTRVPKYQVNPLNTLQQLLVMPRDSKLIDKLNYYLLNQPTGKSFLHAFPCGDDYNGVLKEYVSKNNVFMCEGKVMIMIAPWQAAIAQVKENNEQMDSKVSAFSCVMS